MKFSRMIALTSVSMLSLTSPAIAQDRPAEGTSQDSSQAEIIVSARRHEERLQDVPATVNVVTSADLHKNAITKFEDIQQLTPGLNLQNSNNGLVQNTSMRGISFDVNSGANSTVAFYWNDGGAQANYIYQSMYDIGQIEVLRGPQGTLRGAAAPSGAITVTTRAPDLDSVGGYAQGQIGSRYFGRRLEAALNVPVIADTLAVRLAGAFDDNEGNGVRSAYPALFPEKPYSRTWSGRVSVRFEPTDNLQANFVYQRLVSHQLNYQQTQSTCLFDATVSCADRGNGSAYAGLVAPSQRLSTISQPREIEQEMDMFNGRIDWHFAGQKLSYVGQYAISHLKPRNPQDFAGYYNGYFPLGVDYRQIVASRNQYETNEVRLASERRIANVFDYVLGFFALDTPTHNSLGSPPQLIPAAYYNSTTPVPVGGGATAPLGALIQSVLARYGNTDCTLYTSVYSCAGAPLLAYGDRKEHAVFGNLTAHLLQDKLELSAGVRYLWDRKISKFPSSAFLSAIGDADTRSEKAIWNASASYRFTPDILGFVRAGTSFRQGLNSLGPVAFTVGQGGVSPSVIDEFAVAKDESSTSYEAGLKMSFLNRRGLFNITYYHQDFTNFQYSAPTFVWVRTNSGTPLFVNGFLASVPVKVNGVEVESSFRFDRELSAGALFSYSKGTISQNGTLPCNGPDGADSALAAPSGIYTCNGGPASFVPRWSLAMHGEYAHDFSNDLTGYLRAQGTIYPKSVYNPASAYDQQRPYAIFNLYAGLRQQDSAWDLTFFVKNLFDQQTVLTNYGGNLPLSTATAGALSALGLVPAQVQGPYSTTSVTPPRQFGATLRVSFGSR